MPVFYSTSVLLRSMLSSCDLKELSLGEVILQGSVSMLQVLRLFLRAPCHKCCNSFEWHQTCVRCIHKGASRHLYPVVLVLHPLPIWMHQLQPQMVWLGQASAILVQMQIASSDHQIPIDICLSSSILCLSLLIHLTVLLYLHNGG